MNYQKTSDKEIVTAVFEYAAQLLKAGESPRAVEEALKQKGLDQKTAAVVVKNLVAVRSKAIRSAGHKNMIYGALWCVGGIVVTAATYTAAEGGGTYVIAWGAIAFGAIQFFRGLAQSASDASASM